MAQTVGRWLYSAYRWCEPPGAPWWRLPSIVLGPPALIVALITGQQLAQVWSTWSAWTR